MSSRKSSVTGDIGNEDEPTGEEAKQKPSAHKKEACKETYLNSGSERCSSSASNKASEKAQDGHSQAKKFSGLKSASSAAGGLASGGSSNSFRQSIGDERNETGQDHGPSPSEKTARSPGDFKGSLKSAAWSVQENKEQGLHFPQGGKVPKWCTSSYVCNTLKEIKVDVKNILKLLTNGIPVTIKLAGSKSRTKKASAGKVPVVKVSTTGSAPRVVHAPPEGIEIILTDEEQERDTLVRIQKERSGSSSKGRKASGTGRKPSTSAPAPENRLTVGRRESETKKRRPSSVQHLSPAPAAKRTRQTTPTRKAPTEHKKSPAASKTTGPARKAKSPVSKRRPQGATRTKTPETIGPKRGPPAKRKRSASGQSRGKRTPGKTAAAKKSASRPSLPKRASARGRPKEGVRAPKKTKKKTDTSATKSDGGGGGRVEEVAQETCDPKDETSQSSPEITEIQTLRHAKMNPNPPRKRREMVSPRRSFHPKNYRQQIERYRREKRKKKEEPKGIEWKSPDWGKLQREQYGISESSDESSSSWIEEIIMPQNKKKRSASQGRESKMSTAEKSKKSVGGDSTRSSKESKSKPRKNVGGKESKTAQIPHTTGDMRKGLAEQKASVMQEKDRAKAKAESRRDDVQSATRKRGANANRDVAKRKDQVLDNLRSFLPASQDLNPFAEGRSTIVQVRTKKFTEEELDVASAWFWNMCCVS